MNCAAIAPQGYCRPKGPCLITHNVQMVAVRKQPVPLCARHRKMASANRKLELAR